MAWLLDVAQAITAALNAQIEDLNAQVAFKVDVEREELTGRQVFVVLAAQRITPADRLGNEHQVDIDVAVFRPVSSSEDLEQIQPGLDDVDAIAALWGENGALRKQRMAGATWRAIENDPAWSPEHMDAHIFASAIRLTYSKSR